LEIVGTAIKNRSVPVFFSFTHEGVREAANMLKMGKSKHRQNDAQNGKNPCQY